MKGFMEDKKSCENCKYVIYSNEIEELQNTNYANLLICKFLPPIEKDYPHHYVKKDNWCWQYENKEKKHDR